MVATAPPRSSPAPRLEGPNRYVFFGLSSVSLLMISIDWGIVAVALPSIMKDLDASLTMVGWVLNASALAQTVAMPLAGKLSEQFGRVRVFIGCLLLFTLGSLLCGLAPNIYLLIAFRVIQGLGGGGFMPSATGIVAREFPERRSQMIGLFASVFPLGGVIGPNLGGIIIEALSWREVFLVCVPIGVIVLLLTLRQARQPEPLRGRSIDIAGTLLFAAMVVALLLALTLLSRDPGLWRSPTFVGLIGASLACLIGFIWQERRAAEPIMDFSLVTRQPFAVVNLYSFLFGACVFGFFSFVPYYANLQYGFGPLESGAVLTPRSVTSIAVSAWVSLAVLQYGYRWPMVGGLLLIALTLFLLSLGLDHLSLLGFTIGPFWLLAAQMTVGGVGMGFAMPSTNNAALDLLPERAAVITGIRGLFRNTGGMLGTAIIVMGIELADDKAEGLRTIFFILSIALTLTSLLVFLIPDVASDRRRLAKKRRLDRGRAAN